MDRPDPELADSPGKEDRKHTKQMIKMIGRAAEWTRLWNSQAACAPVNKLYAHFETRIALAHPLFFCQAEIRENSFVEIRDSGLTHANARNGRRFQYRNIHQSLEGFREVRSGHQKSGVQSGVQTYAQQPCVGSDPRRAEPP